MAHQEKPESSNIPFIFSLLLGGLCLGFGIVSLYGAFGHQGPDGQRVGMAQDLATIGFSGLDNIALLPAADYAVGFVVVGAMLLIASNAMAWRHTNGY